MNNKINKSLKFNELKFNNYKNVNTDLNIRKIKIGSKNIMYIFYESTSSDDKISNFFMKSISYDVKNKNVNLFSNLLKMLENTIPNSKLKTIDNYDDVFYHLASGFTCIFIDGEDLAITIETKSVLDRSISEPTTETIVRGPKDCFTENYMTSLGLIRKRIKDENLRVGEIKVGKKTKTKVSVIYLNDLVDNKKIEQINQKIKSINIDGILDSAYVKEFLVGNNKLAFPKMISTERPDLACSSILDGKVVILVENSPFVLIIPGLFLDYFKNPEDNYQKPLNANFTRILRFFAFLITILTPAIYIAIMTHNSEIIPDKLLISLAIQRQGVPFPTFISVIILLTTFEMLRESDIRMPSIMGSSIGIVGALVLGDAAVSAGIVSPTVVIIVAITSVSGLLFSDIDFINAIRWWRLLFIIGATILGIIGITLVGVIFICKLCSIETLGISYLSPLVPFNLEDQKDNFIRLKRNKLFKRPSYLEPKNKTKLGGNDEN